MNPVFKPSLCEKSMVMFSKRHSEDQFSQNSMNTMIPNNNSFSGFSTISRFADDLTKRYNKLKQLRDEKENSERTMISEQFKPTDRSDKLIYRKFNRDFQEALNHVEPVI